MVKVGVGWRVANISVYQNTANSFRKDEWLLNRSQGQKSANNSDIDETTANAGFVEKTVNSMLVEDPWEMPKVKSCS